MEFLSTGNESLAYRYFLSERAWLGQPGLIWQGHFTTLIQYAIYGVLQAPIFTPADFRTQLQVFASLTLMLNALMTSMFISLAMFDRHLRACDKILVAIAAALPVYGLRNYGLYYLFLPDYYAFNISLSVATVWITLRILRASTTSKSHIYSWVAAGIICGLWLSNKTPSALLMLPVIVALALNSLRSILVFSATAASTVLLVIFAYYLGDLQEIVNLPAIWIDLVSRSQGEGSSDRIAWLTHALRGPYGFILTMGVICGSIATFLQYKQHHPLTERATVWACWLVFAGFCFVILRRPSGTTMFDIGVALIVMTCIWLGTIPHESIRRKSIIATLCVLSMSAFLTFRSDFSPYTDTSTHANERWQLYDTVNRVAQERPILVVLASNDYHHEGVHELILKGAADFPTWNISTRGEQLIDRHAPGLRFVHEYNGPLFASPIPQGTVVVWYDRPDLAPLSKRVPELARLLDTSDYRCTTLPIHKATQIQVIAHVCEPMSL